MKYTGPERRTVRQAFKKEFPYILAAAFVAFLFGVVFSIGYLYWFEKPYLSYENLPFPMRVEHVYVGEVIPVYVVRCSTAKKSRNYSIARALRNTTTGHVVSMPDVLAVVAPGCSGDYSTAHRVPEFTPPGRYRLFGSAEIHTNFRQHQVEFYSQEFEVLPGKRP